jgi:DNA-binding NtrC family response regulator/class 3 adenylate cyclase/tetratricopeptide (TPR) repeat protein
MAQSGPILRGHPTDRIVGNAPAIDALRAQICHLAAFDTVGSAFVPTLLLQGETGTGKGLVARVIHDSGPRAQGPFIYVNCAAIPETLLEVELFGFEAGTFTDAKRAKPGLVESASYGTLFLDEIDALPLLLQAKLLSTLDEKRVRRLGAVGSHQLDVKVIAAATTDLSQRVTEGRFRSDLYHRLTVVVLEVPPLRERGEDILVLAQHFLRQYAAAHGLPPKRLHHDAEAWLQGYGWPGNVRELSHLMERVTLLTTEAIVATLTLEQLCLPRPLLAVRSEAPAICGATEPLDEPARIRQALSQTGGNVVQAVRLLGVSRGTLRYWMRRYGIGRPNLRALTPSHGHRAQEASGSFETERGRSTSVARLTLEPAWEQKPVVVLAIDAAWPEAIDLHASRVEPWTLVTRWQQAIAERVQGFGGRIVQHSSSPCTAIFGIPQTLEQMPQRAVQAALAIRHQLAAAGAADGRQPGPEVRMAVHLGQVLVDVQASDPTARLLALGETLSLPVRLLGQAAPGDILLSPQVGQLVEGWFELHGRQGAAGAGLSDGIGAYAVVGVGPRCSPLEAYGKRPLSRFVGRERELAALHDLLAHVAQGHGQVVGLVGEPGVGKSRLCYEVTQAQRTHGWLVLESSPVAYGKDTPYLPVLDLLRVYFQLEARDEPQTIRAKVLDKLRTLDAGLEPILPAMLALLDVPVDDPHWQALELPQRRQHTLDGLKRLLLWESQIQPVLLVVENFHWVDTETQAFLDHLVDSLLPACLLLLVNYRPDYHHGWGSKTYYTQLRLDPLPPAHAEALLHGLLGDHLTLAPLIRLLIARTEGNPFFLEESVHTLIETGVLVGEPGAYCLAKPLEGLQVPATVQAVLAARIDRLPPEEKRLLQTAAVIGTEVPLSLLQAIAELPEATLHRGLAHLQRAEFLYETHLFPEQEYTFKHALTHEVAYGSLLLERRRSLHARLVKALETLAPEQAAEQVDRLAHHALRGAVWDKAVTYCQQAGTRAYDRAAFREAVATFDQALQVLAYLPEDGDTQVRAIELRLAVDSPLMALGEPRRRLALLGEAAVLARALDDRVRLGRVLAQMAQGRKMTGDHNGAVVVGQQALALATALGDSAVQVEASVNLGQAYADLGDFGRSAELLRRSVAAADQEPGTPGTHMRIRSRAWLARTLGMLGAFAEGRHYGEEALRLATLEGRGSLPILAYSSLGLLSLTQGDLEPASRMLEQSLALCRASDNRNFFRAITAGLGYAYALQGRLTEGRALLEEAISDSICRGVLAGYPLRVAWLSECCRLAGRGAEAWQHACQALDLARQHKERAHEALALHQLGIVQAHADPPDTAQAETYYQQALALAEELGMRPLVAHYHLGLGRLYGQTGRGEQARAALATAIELYRAMDMPFWLPQAEAALARTSMASS